MPYNSWNIGFHLRAPSRWVNDPNGLCQFRGTYRFFYQYNPYWPEHNQKLWAQYSSEDLVHWRYEGVALEPDTPEDRNGVYSGCAVVERGAAADGGDRLVAYYTGNVIDLTHGHNPRDVGFVNDSREGNTLLCASDDGVHFGEKVVLLRPADYPDYCSLHVRDPKVWEQDGELHMVLGARDIGGVGLCLLYDSANGYDWTFRHAIRPEYPFGYMWECPNIVQMEGHEYLAFSPQGLPRMRDRWHNLCQAGYIPVRGRILDAHSVDERDFQEWDHGHDFYAPQTFVDDAGRAILVGWMGVFDGAYDSAPDGLDWCHCLTVPRQITRDEQTGRLLQLPVEELNALRRGPREFGADGALELEGRLADVELGSIAGDGSLTFDDSFQVFFENGRLGIRYLQAAHAAGRQDRSIPCNSLRDLRVLVDGSAVEVFANGGAEVFSCRWFCAERPTLCVNNSFAAGHARAWAMEDVLSEVFAQAL